MKLFDVYPINDITVVKALGSYVWDNTGTRYLDMYGGHAVISIGHTHPHWVSRINGQLEQIAFYSNSIRIPIQQELAAVLGRVSGNEDYQLFLCNSGAEANENALKLASFHTGRKKIISFTGAFHGRTSLAVAATDNPSIIAPVNESDNIIQLPFNDVAALEQLFAAQGNEVAAVIIEAIQGVGGIRVASDDFLHAIRTLCTRHGSLFIADEVQCGYGRSGEFFCTQTASVAADIYTMAKGMGNGFPIGGILIAPHVQAKHGLLGTTFGGAHLACSAALAVLEVIEGEALLENVKEQGAYLLQELRQIPCLQNIRGKGLMIGFDVPPELKDLRKNLLAKHHIFTGEAKPNVIRLLPALNISRAQVEDFLHALRSETELVYQGTSAQVQQHS
jgi:acetylornithine aminotransferase